MTLTTGTTVAATTVQEDVVRQMLGITPSYGRAVVLGPIEFPAEVRTAATEAGIGDPIAAGFEAYVIEPREGDGSPLTPGTGPAGVDVSDLAYVAVLSPSSPVASHPQIGALPTVVLANQVSKSDYLASLDVKNSAAIDKFREELDDGVFLIANELDDALDPEFPDGTDSDGTN